MDDDITCSGDGEGQFLMPRPQSLEPFSAELPPGNHRHQMSLHWHTPDGKSHSVDFGPDNECKTQEEAEAIMRSTFPDA